MVHNTDSTLSTKPTSARLASFFLIALIVLSVAWELWLAPLRPGGSWWVLKVLPLLFMLRGTLRGNLYTLQWASMLMLLYMAESLVRGMGAIGIPAARPLFWCAWVAFALSWAYFFAAILYVRPYKRAFKQKENSKNKND